jgi:hypothetical protein
MKTLHWKMKSHVRYSPTEDKHHEKTTYIKGRLPSEDDLQCKKTFIGIKCPSEDNFLLT